MGLCRLQEELKASKQEILEMRAEVEAKDERWWQEKQRLEQEKLELIQVGRGGEEVSCGLNFQSHMHIAFQIWVVYHNPRVI